MLSLICEITLVHYLLMVQLLTVVNVLLELVLASVQFLCLQILHFLLRD